MFDLSIYESFDRYERMPYWTVRRSRNEAAVFQSWIYGERAESLARHFYQAISQGIPWSEAYAKIPLN